MKIGLVGPSYEQRSLPFDAQRTINLFPIIDQSGKETTSLLGTPGLSVFASTPIGPARGCFKSSGGRVFFVIGSGLYELSSTGTTTLLGSLITSTGQVSMCEGTTQLAISDEVKIYYLTYATNAFGQVTDADLPTAIGYITNIDGYFVVANRNTGKFYISDINDVTSWQALDYATAESSPDYLLVPLSAVGQLWLLGEKTTEIWSNTGASVFPFARIAGAVMKVGVLAKYTAREVDNTVFWVGRDELGAGIVYRANGFTPLRISTATIEKRITEATDATNIVSWTYQEDGHLFYVLTGGGLETSLVYDVTTQQWHERAYLSDLGTLQAHVGTCHVFAFQKHLIGSYLTGDIYTMSLDTYDDAGRSIVRERVYTHICDEGRPIRFNSLEIGMESGVGSVAGSDPQVALYISKDGARTWSDPMTGSFGKIGEYRKKVKFRRLGVADQLTFKLRVTDSVKVAITGSYLK